MMPSPLELVEEAVRSALRHAFGDDMERVDPQVRSSAFADFQANAALGLAHSLGKSPREIAAQIAEHLHDVPGLERVEISGPGYLNVWIADSWLDTRVVHPPQARTAHPQTVVIDYSSPNVAKVMHVGHLRTTIVGDALARVHTALGNTVVRQNHVGDWGTPFGMLLEHLLDVGEVPDGGRFSLAQMTRLYRDSRARFDGEPGFADRARARVVLLQAEDPETIASWLLLVDSSIAYFTDTYRVLGVSLGPDDVAGESSYRHELDAVVDDLTALGLTAVSDGALCVFPEGFRSRSGDPLPLIIRKSDGGFTYAATDLAAIRRRVGTLHADRILYVVGEPQSVHFAMLFAVARQAGWLPETTIAEHVQIGNVLGSDGKILRSRSGDTPSLAAAVDEAVGSAIRQLRERGGSHNADALQRDGRIIGVGALKFSDLLTHHDAEYVFDIDRMLKPNGNTGPYVQYAAVRINAILAQADPVHDRQPVVEVRRPEERSLALRLADFDRTIRQTATLSQPHLIAEHLIALAQAFNEFYDRCPVLKAEDVSTRESRVTLCRLTLTQLSTGLGLLGIEIPAAM